MAFTDNLDGEWFMAGDGNRPCALFQRGRVLLVVNEQGSVATGRVIGPTTLQVIQGSGWQPGMRAELQDNGRALVWPDGSFWRRF
jgi:hypothetical protein